MQLLGQSCSFVRCQTLENIICHRPSYRPASVGWVSEALPITFLEGQRIGSLCLARPSKAMSVLGKARKPDEGPEWALFARERISRRRQNLIVIAAQLPRTLGPTPIPIPGRDRFFATLSTMPRRWVSRSSTSDFRFCQSIRDRDRAIIVSCFRISFATSAGLALNADAASRSHYPY